MLRPLTIVLALLLIAASTRPVAAETSASDQFEKDRAAILAMAGEYRVKFQFMETIPLLPGYERHEPHMSNATEFVEVIEDTGDRIVLQHILVLDHDDAETGQRVVKHWRQDWVYQNTLLYEFTGDNTWTPRTLSDDEARGTWTQRVFQVDDSPRYQGFGHWTHRANLSSWESNETWRPLPRREWLTRSDYQVLVAVNRHTITPDGWVHEQDNFKLVLADDGEGAASQQVLAREVGLNIYTKVDDYDFTLGREYWEQTRPFWRDVRAAWDELFAAGQPIRLHRRVDDKPMFRHMFDQANQVKEAGAYDPEAGSRAIRETLTRFLDQNHQRRAASH
jgi:hypothetical protein